jgi:hypothetical protein
MSLHVSGVTRPSSGRYVQMLFGVITCVGCVLTACRYCVDENAFASETMLYKVL